MIAFLNGILHSQRLSFRLLHEDDQKDLFSIVQEPDTTKPAGFLPIFDPAAFEDFWQGLTAQQTGVAVLLHDRCIGYYHVNPYVPDDPLYQTKKNVAIGFLLGKNYLRMGYATEMLMTLNPRLLTTVDAIWGDCFAENVASRKTLEKCGFRAVDTYDMVFPELNGENKHIISHVLCK